MEALKEELTGGVCVMRTSVSSGTLFFQGWSWGEYWKLLGL